MAGYVQRWKGRFVTVADSLFSAGKGSAFIKAGGNLTVNSTSGNSAATASAQTLATYSIPANTLDIAGRGIEIQAFGTKAANAAPVNLGITVGGLAFTGGASTASGVSWMMSAAYYKTGANAQIGRFSTTVGTTPGTTSVQADTAADTAAIVVNVTATDASAASANVVFKGLIVRMYN